MFFINFIPLIFLLERQKKASLIGRIRDVGVAANAAARRIVTQLMDLVGIFNDSSHCNYSN